MPRKNKQFNDADESESMAPLSFARMDIERRLCVPAGRFTQPGPILAPLCALLATIVFYACLLPLGDRWIAATFMERSWVPYVVVFFTFWALMILLVKRSKVRVQRESLHVPIVSEDPDFVL